jgi:hypothetical protein
MTAFIQRREALGVAADQQFLVAQRVDNPRYIRIDPAICD